MSHHRRETKRGEKHDAVRQLRNVSAEAAEVARAAAAAAGAPARVGVGRRRDEGHTQLGCTLNRGLQIGGRHARMYRKGVQKGGKGPYTDYDCRCLPGPNS
jgi:hypothetical protein